MAPAAIALRPALPQDAAMVARLIGELGYTLAAEIVHDRLARLGPGTPDTVRLACDGDAILGLIALHCAPMLHAARPVARITTLVVAASARGRGVGRALVEDAASQARAAGCGVLELTTALHRTEAQAFYRAIGFEASSLRMHRGL